MDDAWDHDYRRRGRLYRGGARLPSLPDGARVLEVGCGDGRTLETLAARRCTAVGLDRSLSALRLCRTLHGRAGDLLVRGDARSLPFQDGSFDAVLLLHVLGHGREADRRVMATEAVRVAAHTGLVHLRVFSCDDFRAGLGHVVEEGSRLRRTGVLTHYFTEDEVAGLFPSCRALRLETVRWQLRVRGKSLPRAEIGGIFAPDPSRGRQQRAGGDEKNHNA